MELEKYMRTTITLKDREIEAKTLRMTARRAHTRRRTRLKF